jgi:hypothetical protein
MIVIVPSPLEVNTNPDSGVEGASFDFGPYGQFRNYRTIVKIDHEHQYVMAQWA